MFLPLLFTAADPGFDKGSAPVQLWSRDLCPHAEAKAFCSAKNLDVEWFKSYFYVDYIDQELYRDIKVPIMSSLDIIIGLIPSLK